MVMFNEPPADPANGEMIAYHRAQVGASVAEWAKELGVSAEELAKIEAGTVLAPVSLEDRSFSLAEKILSAVFTDPPPK